MQSSEHYGTDQVASLEQRLAAFSDEIPLPVHSVNSHGIIRWANEAELQLLGYAREEYVGHDIRDFQVELDMDIASRMLAGETLRSQRLQMRCKDGGVKDFLLDASAQWVNDRYLGSRCFLRDVSERRQLERELCEARQRKDEFIAMLGHELRNPLAPIANGTRLLRKLLSHDPDVGRICEMFERQIATMRRLLDDLLDMSRLNQGKIRFVREPHDLQPIIQSAVELCRPVLERQRQQLSVELPVQRLRLLADATRLSQAISNLLDNAIKYTPSGGQIGIAVVRLDGHISVQVQDNGIGIDAQLLPHVFDLFAQGEHAIVPLQSALGVAQSGLGVGLALAQRVVSAHDGTIAAESSGSGHGSRFTVILPSLDDEVLSG
jgi:PAS domain S-box-containing protein